MPSKTRGFSFYLPAWQLDHRRVKSGERTLNLKSVDRLCEALGLELRERLPEQKECLLGRAVAFVSRRHGSAVAVWFSFLPGKAEWAGMGEVAFPQDCPRTERAMAKRRKHNGVCVYCGETGPVTDDHVPAESIFPESCRSHLITVPACARCNSKVYSKDDEYFRSRLMLRVDVNRWDAPLDSVLRGFNHPKKVGFRRAFERSLFTTDIHSPDAYLGREMAYTVDKGRIHRVMERVVRGLFYHETSRLLPDTHRCIAPEASDSAPDFQKFIENIQTGEHRVIGGGAFEYWYKPVDGDLNASLWLMGFYQGIWFVGATWPKGALPEEPECAGFAAR